MRLDLKSVGLYLHPSSRIRSKPQALLQRQCDHTKLPGMLPITFQQVRIFCCHGISDSPSLQWCHPVCHLSTHHWCSCYFRTGILVHGNLYLSNLRCGNHAWRWSTRIPLGRLFQRSPRLLPLQPKYRRCPWHVPK